MCNNKTSSLGRNERKGKVDIVVGASMQFLISMANLKECTQYIIVNRHECFFEKLTTLTGVICGMKETRKQLYMYAIVIMLFPAMVYKIYIHAGYIYNVENMHIIIAAE